MEIRDTEVTYSQSSYVSTPGSLLGWLASRGPSGTGHRSQVTGHLISLSFALYRLLTGPTLLGDM